MIQKIDQFEALFQKTSEYATLSNKLTFQVLLILIWSPEKNIEKRIFWIFSNLLDLFSYLFLEDLKMKNPIHCSSTNELTHSKSLNNRPKTHKSFIFFIKLQFDIPFIFLFILNSAHPITCWKIMINTLG